jgi:hypothetical protein
VEPGGFPGLSEVEGSARVAEGDRPLSGERL